MPRKLVLAVVTTAAFVQAHPFSSLAQAPFAFTWGGDVSGQLGDGLPLASRNFPVPVLDATGGCCLDRMVDIQGADTHSLALDSSLRVWTWGSNYVGQLGNGSNGPGTESPIPIQVPGLFGRLPAMPVQETIAAEGAHNLVVDGAGTVWAWGANDRGQLGVGSPGPPTCGGPPPFFYPCSASPVQVALGTVVGVGAGARHSLAIVGDCSSGPSDAYAWGANSSGQLGDNTITDRFTPVQVHGPLDVGFLTGVAKMVGGQAHTVALMCNGDVLAWGENGQGQLGSGSTASSAIPTAVVTQCPLPPRPLLGCPLTNIVDIAAGFDHSLAVDSAGNVWFWGNNQSGQLCNGTTADLVFATQVLSGALTSAPAGVPLDVVAAGANFSLVLTAQHSLVACGANAVGQLGDCTNADSSTAVPVRDGPACSLPFAGVSLVEAGESHGLLLGDTVPVATPSSAPTASATTSPTRPMTQTATPIATRPPTVTHTRTSTATVTPTPLGGCALSLPTPGSALMCTGSCPEGQECCQVNVDVCTCLSECPSPTPTPTPTCGEPLSVDISTGSNAVPIGGSDLAWTLIAAPAGTTNFSSPGPATVIVPNSAWTTLPNTQWISANTGCTNTLTPDCPGGLYSYQLCWEQCGALMPSPLQVLADNTATVSLDGVPLATTPPTIDFTTAATLPGFTLSTGVHTLQVDVHNTPFSGGGGTATGMNLSGVLNGDVRLVPCPGAPCTGDCDGDEQVTVNELIAMVNIALGRALLSVCIAGDADGSGAITIAEIIAAVNNALSGCPLVRAMEQAGFQALLQTKESGEEARDGHATNAC